MFLQSSYHPVNTINIVPTVPTHYSSSFPIFLLSLPLPPVPPFFSPPLPSLATPLFSAGKEKQQKQLMNKESKEKRADMRDQLKQKVGHLTSHDLTHDLVPPTKGFDQPHCLHIVYISHTEYTYSVCVLMLACVCMYDR